MPLKRVGDTASLELNTKCVGGRDVSDQGRWVTPPEVGFSADLGDSSDYPYETYGHRRGAGFCVKVKLPQLSRKLCTEGILCLERSYYVVTSGLSPGRWVP